MRSEAVAYLRTFIDDDMGMKDRVAPDSYVFPDGAKRVRWKRLHATRAVRCDKRCGMNTYSWARGLIEELKGAREIEIGIA